MNAMNPEPNKRNELNKRNRRKGREAWGVMDKIDQELHSEAESSH